MNIEGQIHQKNPGMGQTPPPFLAMPGFWQLLLGQPLPYMVRVHSEHSTGLLPWNKGGASGVEIGRDVRVRLGMILLAVLHRD